MKIFYDDVRDKKRTASGVHSKKGKNGFVGKMLTTSDLLKGKAKREYQGTGKVWSYNMNTIAEKDEFFSWTKEQQKQALTAWREVETNKAIMDRLGFRSTGAFHNFMKDLGVPKKQRGGSRKGKTYKKKPKAQEEPKAPLTLVPPERKKGMSFEWDLQDTEMNEIKQMLTKLEFLVENDQDKKFSIKIELNEWLD